MWSMWVAWLLGQRPSRELVEAAKPLTLGERLQARRAARRGEAAIDVAAARYALALGRSKRHVRSQPLLVALVLLMLCVPGALLVENLSRNGWDGAALVFLIATVSLAVESLPVLDFRRKAPVAEVANERFLAEHGYSCPKQTEGHRRATNPPWLGAVLGMPATFVFYDLWFGLGTLALDGKTLALGKVIVRGALFGIAMTVFSTFFRDRRRETEAERSTA